MEVCLPVKAALTTAGDAVARQLAGGKVASVMLHKEQCEFPAVLKGYDVAYDWMHKNGFEPIESPREIWYGQPGVEDPEDRMEIAWLFRQPAA